MHLATSEKSRIVRTTGSKAPLSNLDDGFRVLVGAEKGHSETLLCAILERAGVDCYSVENVEQLRRHLASSVHQLAVISLSFWQNGAKQIFESPDEVPHGQQFALWVGDQPVEIDSVVEAIRLGAAAVVHGASCESRLLSLVRESLVSTCKARDAEEVKGRELSSKSDVSDESSPVRRGQSARESAGCRSRLVETSLKNGSNGLGVLPSTFSSATESDSPREQLKRFILGRSASVQSIRDTILNVASTRATVMIFGESGTGKELVARAVHHFSDRSQQPFVPVNMSAVPEGLAESLLFGHEKGSFTSAYEKHQGWCQTAHGGTLFLDEIGDMELAVQPKLLRFLQEGTLQTVGAKSSSHVDVRLITATNRDPKTIVREGRLREDLFFRLHVVPIFVPPLRERREDIALLAEYFLHRSAERHGRNVTGLSEEAIQILTRFNWPGNVRQLENAIERVVIFAQGEIAQAMDIPAEFHAPARLWNSHGNGQAENFQKCNGVISTTDMCEAHVIVEQLTPFQINERTAIIDALQRSAGHVVDAAKLLGLGQATMYRKIKQFGVPHERKRRKLSPR